MAHITLPTPNPLSCPHMERTQSPLYSSIHHHLSSRTSGTKSPSNDLYILPYDVPSSISPSHSALCVLILVNFSSKIYNFAKTDAIYNCGNHWYNSQYAILINDDGRQLLHRTLNPHDHHVMHVIINAPPQPGRYLLSFDIVAEGYYWLSEKGLPLLYTPVTVL